MKKSRKTTSAVEAPIAWATAWTGGPASRRGGAGAGGGGGAGRRGPGGDGPLGREAGRVDREPARPRARPHHVGVGGAAAAHHEARPRAAGPEGGHRVDRPGPPPVGG